MSFEWTKKREQYLKDVYGTEPVLQTARYFGITKSALAGKAWRMGLTVAARNPTKKATKVITTVTSTPKAAPKPKKRKHAGVQDPNSNKMKKLFVDLWNTGEPPSRIALQCGYKSAKAVTDLAQSMGLAYQNVVRINRASLRTGEPEPLGDIDGGCLFLHGPAKDRNFCGVEKDSADSYCSFHMGTCYNKPPKRDRKARTGAYVPSRSSAQEA